jgi:cell wall-associated NlpC family hydrolase
MTSGPCRQPPSSWKIAAVMLVAILCGGCIQRPHRLGGESSAIHSAESRSIGRAAARIAKAQVGAPYRYGGETASGFDCSGLVKYSFARAGRSGLPRSVSGLADLARPVRIKSLEVGDLLFFRLGWRMKKLHVGIYLGDRRFVHSPSSGKSVEVVSFDHVYWGPRIKTAGRIVR